MTQVHLSTALLGWLLPFKIGEIFRLWFLSRCFTDWREGVSVWLIERVYDLIIWTVFLIALRLLYRDSVPHYDHLILILIFTLLLFGVFFWVVQDFSVFFIKLLITSSRSNRALLLLVFFRWIHEFHSSWLAVIRNRGIAVSFVTLLIWFFEGLTVMTLFVFEGGNLSQNLAYFFEGLVGLLSSSPIQRIYSNPYNVVSLVGLSLLFFLGIQWHCLTRYKKPL